MALKIYTRTGDKGQTGLLGGARVPKSHLRVEAYGTVDELNAHVGLCADQQPEADTTGFLRQIQEHLFVIGSCLADDSAARRAGSGRQKAPMALPALREADVRLLETEIDKMEAQLPPLKAFLLPGGHPAVSGCHIARCVCRRAERLSVRMEDQGLAVAPLILAYLNRLSDYLFVLARYTAHRLGVAERIWTTR